MIEGEIGYIGSNSEIITARPEAIAHAVHAGRSGAICDGDRH
jgi:hypothetical protein